MNKDFLTVKNYFFKFFFKFFRKNSRFLEKWTRSGKFKKSHFKKLRGVFKNYGIFFKNYFLFKLFYIFI